MALLERIKTPADLKKLSVKELPQVAQEIREKIIAVAEKNGGHLASSLGAVDIIVALYYVFDFPKDKIIFDVGHQSYAHKILSERLETFETIRTKGGLSGFPNIFESKYDAFTVGHAGTSVAASLGYCYSRDKLGEDYYVISLIGDASMFNGENIEALFANETKPEKLLMILNDNGMSISKNTNGLYTVMTKIAMKKHYSRFKSLMNKIFGWNFIGRFLKSVKGAFKRSLDPYVVLDTVGVKYVGAFDGHNINLLVQLFNDFKLNPQATLLHLKTVKGKGYEPAEASAETYHGISKNLIAANNTFSESISAIAEEVVSKYDNAVFLTAGMLSGTGLKSFKNAHPDKVYDVGISEEYCVTLAAGMAVSGLKPIVCMYSTFLQRAYDQTVIDVALQNLPVVYLIDRAGVVGCDGATHQGVFDISYLSHVPNMTVLMPKSVEELKTMLNYALSISTPVAIRYPNGSFEEIKTVTPFSAESLYEVLTPMSDTVVIAEGPRLLSIALEVAAERNITVVNARSAKPLDYPLLDKIADKKIITMEENAKIGGLGSLILSYYAEKGVKADVTVLGIGDAFVEHATISDQLAANGLTKQDLLSMIDKK